MLCRVLGHCFVDRTHRVHSPLLQPGDVLLVKVTPPHVLVCASVPSLAGRNTISLSSEVRMESWFHVRSRRFLPLNLLLWLVKVLCRVVCCSKGGSIEVIEHQVHALGLAILQVVPNLDVSVDFNFDVGVRLSRQGSRLREATLANHLLVRIALAPRSVPNDALSLARARVATATSVVVVAVLVCVGSPREVMIAIRYTPPSHLLLHFVGIEIFEEVSLMSLVVAHVEGVACHVLLLSVKVFDHGQGVVVGTLLHRIRICRLLLDPASKATLVLDVADRVGWRLLNHSVSVCFDDLLS